MVADAGSSFLCEMISKLMIRKEGGRDDIKSSGVGKALCELPGQREMYGLGRGHSCLAAGGAH